MTEDDLENLVFKSRQKALQDIVKYCDINVTIRQDAIADDDELPTDIATFKEGA